MEDKPDTNFSDSDQNNSRSQNDIGGDHNAVHGDVIIGSFGSSTFRAEQVVVGDMYMGVSAPDKAQEVTEMMTKLEQLIREAQAAGELNETTAQKAMTSLREANALIHKDGRPPKGQIVRRLQYVADVLDTAVDMLAASGGVAEILGRALPVVALLIKVAGRVF